MSGKNNIEVTPLNPFYTGIGGLGFLYCDNRYDDLYVLSNENFSEPYGLGKLTLKEIKVAKFVPDLRFRANYDRGNPMCSTGTNLLQNDLYISTQDVAENSSILISKLGDARGDLPFLGRLSPRSKGGIFGSINYDGRQNKLFAVTVEGNGENTIEVFVNNMYRYSVNTIGGGIYSLAIDEDIKVCYFHSEHQNGISYFSTVYENPLIEQIPFPEDWIVYGNKMIYSHDKKRLFIPGLMNNVDGPFCVFVLDTIKNEFLKPIQVDSYITSYQYLALDPLREIIFYISSGAISDELMITPINVNTLTYPDVSTISLPKGLGGLHSFAIRVQDNKDTLYGISNYDPRFILPIDIGF
jgi:hypothetical protein